MLSELRQYLTKVKLYSKLDAKAENEIVRELKTHFEDEIGELCQAGLSTDEAVDLTAQRFGRAESLGREIYEVYSMGSWRQAILAGAPHFLLALAFVFHLWRNTSWLVAIVLVITLVTIWAWYHGKPSWSYSWLGYLLIPMLALSFLILFGFARVLSLFLSEGTVLWVMMFAYIPLALWLLYYTVISAIQRDWLFASFMLLPFPVIVAWLIALEENVGLVEYAKGGFQASDQGVAFTFLTLGITAGAFIRLKKRLFKIGALTVSTLLILAMVWRFAESGLNPVIFFFVSFCFVSFLLGPVLLQNRVGHHVNEVESWDEAWLKQTPNRT